MIDSHLKIIHAKPYLMQDVYQLRYQNVYEISKFGKAVYSLQTYSI